MSKETPALCPCRTRAVLLEKLIRGKSSKGQASAERDLVLLP